VVLAVVSTLVQQLVALWVTLLLISAPLYFFWCVQRAKGWKAEHEEHRRQLMGEL